MQGDEGKNAFGTTSTEHDCTESTGRLDSNVSAERQQKDHHHHHHHNHHHHNQHQQKQRRQTIRSESPLSSSRHTSALALSNKCHEVKDSNTKNCCVTRSEIIKEGDENYPPDSRVDVHGKTSDKNDVKNSLDVKRKTGLVVSFGSSSYNNQEEKVSSDPRQLISARLSFEKSGIFPANLRASGTTPKLSRKLLISDLDTPSFFRKNVAVETDSSEGDRSGDTGIFEDEEKSSDPDDRSSSERSDKVPVDRLERKIKRSESYRMANSPIMFIKKFSGHSDKSSKIFRSPSEELREDLLKERINYPETVASPEPHIDSSGSSNLTFESDLNFSLPVTIAPVSPRPRALDIEPVRVLKYSGNDTEIW